MHWMIQWIFKQNHEQVRALEFLSSLKFLPGFSRFLKKCYIIIMLFYLFCKWVIRTATTANKKNSIFF